MFSKYILSVYHVTGMVWVLDATEEMQRERERERVSNSGGHPRVGQGRDRPWEERVYKDHTDSPSTVSKNCQEMN